MDTVAVPGVECPCPGTPHPEGDIVTLRSRLGLSAGTQLQTVIVQANQSGAPVGEVAGLLAETYLRVGIIEWTFVDEDGKPVAVTPENIERLLLEDFARATPVADKCDELYAGTVLGPLVNGAAKSSPTTPTAKSTSRPATGSRRSPKRSKPSSTSTTLTGATATTSQ